VGSHGLKRKSRPSSSVISACQLNKKLEMAVNVG